MEGRGGEWRKTSVGELFYKYARGSWVIMSASGANLLTPTAAIVVSSFLLWKECPLP